MKDTAKILERNNTDELYDLLQQRTAELNRKNRELEIEASLERIRSRTMGMQKSTELQEVINLIFVEMTNLGVIMDSSYIITHLDENMEKGFDAWVSIPGQPYARQLFQAYLDHPLVHRFYNAWQNMEPHFATTFSKAEKNRYFRHQFENSPQLKQIPEQRKNLILEGNGWSLSWVILKNAAIVLHRYQNNPFDEEEINIQKRFAKVFEQTYTRFLDLQNAEAQAKEAIKQASLDRIRGQIAGMRNADDLQEITPLIWNELKTLEVPFFRCGVFIMNEKLQKVKVYLTTPEGKPLAALDLDYELNNLTRDTVDSWRKKDVYQTHWTREAFVSWTREMIKLQQVNTREEYQGAESPPESLHLHFIPFAQGMLYVGNSTQLKDEQIELVKSLAKAFSFAYARYHDFVVLEEAKEQAENALAVLKSTQAQLIHAEKMASLGELTAGIAHEIQNPLNFVNNFAELSNELLEEMKEELAEGSKQYAVGGMQSGEEKLKLAAEIATDLKQNLEKIHHHGKRAAEIVKGMLQHSRTNSGQKEFTDINALADEYLRLTYFGLKAKDKNFNAGFKTDFEPNLPNINVIPQDVGRVLLNLINNAFYAVLERQKPPTELDSEEPYKPNVTISTKNLGNRIEISVKDNGPGIPDSIKDKIFQPFFTTKPTGQGTGLGLSLSYDIIKAHGGELSVKTDQNMGSEFFIYLPL